MSATTNHIISTWELEDSIIATMETLHKQLLKLNAQCWSEPENIDATYAPDTKIVSAISELRPYIDQLADSIEVAHDDWNMDDMRPDDF